MWNPSLRSRLIFLGLALLGSVYATSATGQPPPPPPPSCCWPPPCSCSVDVTACPTVVLRVDNVKTATGWGGHFSLSPNENGYGGRYPECHITGGVATDRVTVLCYDGYGGPSDLQTKFEMPLGARSEVDSVEFTVGPRGVQVTAQREGITTAGRVPYQVTSFFPLRESTGFCSAKTLYYTTNGVLNGQSDRSGSGYKLTVTVP